MSDYLKKRRAEKAFGNKPEKETGRAAPTRNGINQISPKRQKRIDAGEPFVKKVADSRVGSEKQYKKDSAEFRKKHPICELRTPVCTRKTQGVHHIKGRATVDLLLDQSEWKAACNPCNLWVEQHPKEAKRLGLKKSPHIK